MIVKQKQSKAVGSIAKRFRQYQATKSSYLVDIILYRYPTEHEVKMKKKMWKGYVQARKSTKQFEISAPVNFVNTHYRKHIERVTHLMEFKRAINFLRTNADFKEMYDHAMLSGGAFQVVYFKDVTSISKGASTYNPLDENLTNAQQISINCKYIHTTLDLGFSNFKQAMIKDTYKDTECWINTITDFYGDTLMDEKKNRIVLPRSIILSIIGKTEDNIHAGVNSKDVLPCFIKFRLQLRVYDCFFKLILRYDPPKRNCHNKAMYCMIKDNHVYTLNHDIKSLEQKPQTETKLVVKASNDYHINDTKGITYFKMIESVDDLMVILQEHSEEKPDDKTIINLMYKGNQLSGFFMKRKMPDMNLVLLMMLVG